MLGLWVWGQLPVPKCAATAELTLAMNCPDHAGHDSGHANGLRYGHANGGHDESRDGHANGHDESKQAGIWTSVTHCSDSLGEQ